MYLELPDDVAELVARRAAATGIAPEEVAVCALRSTLRDNDLEQVLQPIREAFVASGMTEDEAVALFEQEKHALRRGE